MTAVNSEWVKVRYEKIKDINVCIHDIVFENMHEQDALEVGIVLEGTVKVQSQEGETLVPAGGLLLFNAYEPHQVLSVSAESVRVLYMQISNHFGRDYFSRISNVEFDNRALASLSAQSTDAIRQLVLSAAQTYFREPTAFQLECAGQTILLLAALFRELPYKVNTDAENITKRKKMGRVQRIASYIEQHYKEKLTLSQLAESEGITTTYMSHVFRELFHMSFQEYLNMLRLERALPLMRDPSLYLVDICMECGFSDSRYLNFVCQKEFGCNASEFRKRQMHQKPASAGPLRRGASKPGYSDRDSLRILENYLNTETGCPACGK